MIAETSPPELDIVLPPPGGLPIGLGCSRLGSINGATGDEARRLIHLALDQGVRVFDTANIYGQGDSERLLGEVLGRRDDCVICSKAGKHLSLRMKIAAPLKGMLQGLVRRSGQARRRVSSARARPMPMRWDPPFLLDSIEGSLRRLKRDRIEIFMLHSPPAQALKDGMAVGALASARQAGKIGVIGVSVDDIDAAEAALNDVRVRVLQLPLRPGETAFDSMVRRASSAGVAVIAREILGGPQAVTGAVDPGTYARDRITQVIRTPGVSIPLVGTTRVVNLNASIAAARAAR